MTKVEERPLSTPMPPNIASPMLILLQRLHLFGQRQPAVFGSGFFLAQHFEFFCQRGEAGRSEEHTSELQSLMRISYAVFCLKKKTKTKKKSQCDNITHNY